MIKVLKYMGLIVIFCCAVYGGRLVSRTYKCHVQALEEFILLIKFIMNRIEYFRTPLLEIFDMYMENNCCGVLGSCGFLRELKKLGWNASLKKYWKKLCINEGEYHTLFRFGNELGVSGSEEQIKNCEYCLARLESEYKKAGASLNREIKLASALSIGIGLMIIIILI